MKTEIIYPNEKLYASFHRTLAKVAAERVYIEMVEAPPLEKVMALQKGLVEKNGPVYYAVDGEEVVGWCDVFPYTNVRLCHRGGARHGFTPRVPRPGTGLKTDAGGD